MSASEDSGPPLTAPGSRRFKVAEREERDRAIGQRIAEARSAAGYTQKEFALVLEMQYRTLQKLEAGQGEVLFHLPRISAVTGVTIEWLVRGDHALVSPDRQALREELSLVEERLRDHVSERLSLLEDRLAEKSLGRAERSA